MTNTAILHPALDLHERLSGLEPMTSEEMQGVDGGGWPSWPMVRAVLDRILGILHEGHGPPII